MIPTGHRTPDAADPAPVAPPVTAHDVRVLVAGLAVLGHSSGVEASASRDIRADVAALDVMAALEALKSAACAAQARLAVHVDLVRRQHEAAMGVPTDKRGRGVAGEIALARRESPHRGSRLLGLAKALVNEMPHTMAAMTRGELNEWRATLMVRETAVLERQDRAAVDTELADELPTLSDRQVAARARAIAYRIDPSSALKRGRHATSERYVAIRPAPDTMAIVSAYLPVRDGVACYAALRRHAETLKAGGAERSLSQLMADIFIERLTGRTPAVGPDIEIALIMTDQALFGAGESPTNPATESTGPTPDSPASAPPTSTPPASAHPKPAPPQPAPPKPSSEPAIRPTIADAPEQEPASLVGYGPIPAALAREFIRSAEDGARAAGATAAARAAKIWIRRLYADPVTGVLTRMDTQRRLFSPAQRRFLVYRDQYCRTPWCGTPIRHADHATPHANGGPTSIDNGQGLCERCNHTKEAPGWTARADTDRTVSTTTPSGATYRSRPPALTPSGARAESAPADWRDSA